MEVADMVELVSLKELKEEAEMLRQLIKEQYDKLDNLNLLYNALKIKINAHE